MTELKLMDSEVPKHVEQVTRPRVVVVEQVIYQHPLEQATEIRSSFSRDLASEEQPYQRRKKIGETLIPVDLGWVAETGCGLLLIENMEGKLFATIPTDEEKAIAAGKILELIVDNMPHGWRIRPGESFRGDTPPGAKLFIRCLSGEAVVRITAYPE